MADPGAVSRLLLAPFALLAVGSLVGCSSSGPATSTGGSADGGPAEVTVIVSDTGCDPGTVEVSAGTVKLTAKNAGGEIGELEVLQGDKVKGEAENIAPDFTTSFTVDVEPGTYELVCYTDKAPKGSLVAR
ncbi:MAG: cupredoxin domain-containing protein [Acidimicrobiales bacterium]